MRTSILLLLLLTATVAAREAHAQEGRPAQTRGGVSGAVVETDGGTPLGDVTLVLEPAGSGAFPGQAPAGSGFLSTSRTTQSDSLGAYRFADVPPGRYRLHALRVGYRRYSVELALTGPAELSLSIGLAPSPVPLAGLELTARRADPFLRARAPAPPFEARVTSLLSRGGTLATDALELTHDDVVEGITLGEPDLFRALQRLPGVSTRSDYTAELWTRGASWDHTRVYFDGVPLFNPLHGLGAFSGLGPGAVGAVWLHPGVQPTALGGGAAASVDLSTRRGRGHGELNAAADLSLVSASVALDQQLAEERVGWMLTGRRTYVDWLSDAVAGLSGRDDGRVPYAFADLTGRVDAALGGGHVVEASGLWQRDRFSGERVAGASARPAAWGTRAARVTVGTPLGGWIGRHTAGYSEHAAEVRDSSAVTRAELLFPPETESHIALMTLTGVWRPREALAPGGWSGGWGLERYDARYAGLPALPVPRFGTVTDDLGQEEADSLAMSGRITVGSLWVERLWEPRSSVLVQAGLRAEVSEADLGGSPLRMAPRLSVRWHPAGALALSAGWGRSYQYAQALAPSGVQLASLSSTLVWLLAGDAAPVLATDLLSAGGEAWLDDVWRASVHAYLRRSRGLAVPDPSPGPVFERPIWVRGEAEATGVEVGVRRLAGPWTGSVGYALSLSQVEAEGLRFPGASDRRHTLDATLMLGLRGGARAGAAFTAASGVPYTRILGGPQDCPSGSGCAGQPIPWTGAPNGARSPAYASLDLLLDWTGSVGGREVGGYVQLRNALGRDNSTVYLEARPGCIGEWCGPRALLEERREPGLPRLPVLGVRVRF